jgi:hypothetical protein
MDTVQLAIANASYASALRELLVRNGAFKVLCVDRPDLDREGVLVVDSERLKLLPMPLREPQRIVLIARNDPASLSKAWEAGVSSVVFEVDPLNTAVLAIMSARLQLPIGKRGRAAGNDLVA